MRCYLVSAFAATLFTMISTGADRSFDPPEMPIDPRINAEKITEQELPPLPEQVLLPLPPDHRIAESALEVPVDDPTFVQAQRAIENGIAHLIATQHESGGWMIDVEAAPTDEPGKPSPVSLAVTALALKAIVQADRTDDVSREAIAKALRYIQSGQKQDGTFEGGALTNYVTSSVVSALASIDSVTARETVNASVNWLRESQWDQSEGLNPKQDWFGGAGYGKHGRPDLSNTQMMLEAMYDAGMSPDEPAFQKALAFLSRTQNLKSVNSAEWAGNDGGFVYTAANGGESMASQYAGEGRYGENSAIVGSGRSLRSYGSMTYAGFKSLLYAGMSPDDQRVRAAFDWIRNHWTFDENPGVGQQGLYYYYHTIARALRIAQQDVIEDVKGVRHNWRAELIDALVERQNGNGSWMNAEDRWLESHAPLTTAYSVLALEEAIKPVGMIKTRDDSEGH